MYITISLHYKKCLKNNNNNMKHRIFHYGESEKREKENNAQIISDITVVLGKIIIGVYEIIIIQLYIVF